MALLICLLSILLSQIQGYADQYISERRADERIVNGTETGKNVYPFMAFIKLNFENGAMKCGGSLLNHRYVLTAAHCVYLTDQKSFGSFINAEVYLGVHNKSTLQEEGIQILEAKQILINDYHTFDGRPSSGDIALLRLVTPAEYTRTVQPICLSAANKSYSEVTATAIGWGKTVGSQTSTVLMEAEIPILQTNHCENYKFFYPRQHICAGYLEGGIDACQGDSGGPLFLQGFQSQSVQIGIVSFGKGCAQPGFPGIYTRVSSYANWITESISEEEEVCII